MTRTSPFFAACFAVVGGLAACSANTPPPPNAPQPIVPGSRVAIGVTEQQTVVDQDVVDRLSQAACDRSQSCNRIGPGAYYRDRADCVATIGANYRKELNAAACPDGIGEAGLAQCERSLRSGECTEPGEENGIPSHCVLASICIHRRVAR